MLPAKFNLLLKQGIKQTYQENSKLLSFKVHALFNHVED